MQNRTKVWMYIAVTLVLTQFGVTQSWASTSSVPCEDTSESISLFSMSFIGDLFIPRISALVPSGQCIYADFNGDGIQDLLVQGNTDNDTNYLFIADNDGVYKSISQTWLNGYLGLEWASNTSTLYIDDYNSDGRADIILDSGVNNGVSAVLYTNDQGLFSSVNQTWVYQEETNSILQRVVPGKLDSTYGVGQNGSATYSIPIIIPSGINGLQPNISLSYNSQQGNGLLGVGWSISGISVITRCPSTLDQDGRTRGVQLDTQDNYCLDGQRLLPVDNNTEYRTEIDSSSKIIPVGDTGNGPVRFEVHTKSGQIMEYGGTADSQVNLIVPSTSSSPIVQWALNKVTDVAGNELTVSYIEEQAIGHYRISRIDYGENDLSVRFVYPRDSDQNSQRPDIIEGFVAGGKFSTPTRLANVQTYVGNRLARDYRINYELGMSTGRSRISKILECAGITANSECKTAATFHWKAEKEGWAKQDDKFIPPDWTDVYGSNWEQYGNFVDLNGDGRQDFVIKYFHNSSDQRKGAWLNTPDGWVQRDAWITPDWTGVYGWAGDYGRFIDLNGDGLVDYVVKYFRNSSDVREGAWLNTGKGWSESKPQWIPPEWTGVDNNSWGQNGRYVDLNGDGLLDFVIKYFKSSTDQRKGAWINTGDGWDRQDVWITPDWTDVYGWAGDYGRFIDLNGDGLVDYVVRYFHTSSDVRQGAWLNTGKGWSESKPQWIPPEWTGVDNDSWGQNGRYVDLNGDGLLDFVIKYFKSSTDQRKGAWINTGNGWDRQDVWITPDWTDVYGWAGDYGRFIDLNGDGFVDYVVKYFHTSSDVRQGAWLNTGKGWSESKPQWIPPEWTGVDSDSWGQNGRYVDFNGDGLQDFVIRYFHTSTDQREGVWLNDLGKPDLIESVSMGNEQEVSFQYRPLTNNTIYTKYSNSLTCYPVCNIQFSSFVVSDVESDNGIGGTNTTSYHYEGAKVHVRGRGFLGFAKVTQTNQSTGFVSATNYNQLTANGIQPSTDFWKNGMVASSSQTINGVEVSKETNQWEARLSDVGLVVPYLARSEQVTKDVNTNLVISKKITNETIDEYGNILLSTVGIYEGDKNTSLEPDYKQETLNTYVPPYSFSSIWLPGQIESSTVTSMVPNVLTGIPQSETQKKRVEYYLSDIYNEGFEGQLKTEITEPDEPVTSTLRLTKRYKYDTYGNIRESSVEGTGISPTRVTSTDYVYLGDLMTATVTNAFNQSEIKSYDRSNGRLLNTIGPNGIVGSNGYTTEWQYDGFGRKTYELRADGNSTNWNYNWCDYNCDAGEVYYVTKQSSGSAPASIYYDKLGRKVRTEKAGFNGALVNRLARYDGLGRALGVTNNYFKDTQTPYWTCSEYDVLGRANRQTVPTLAGCDNTVGLETLASTVYDGLKTAVTKHNQGQAGYTQQTTIQWKNAIGQLVQVQDALNNPVTKYYYNAIGNLVQVTDAAGNEVKTGYDKRGRKTSMDDPDMGQWAYGYNAVGELTWQRDAKGQEVTTIYDALGRIKTRIEPDTSTSTWVYDEGYKAIGKLSEVSNDQSGYKRVYEYDNFGRSKSTVTDILFSPYRMDTAYDQFGRISTVTYPPTTGGSRFSVQNCYDSYGHLREVREPGSCFSGGTTYWKSKGVNANGQVSMETLGNGITTARVYDEAWGHLAALSSGAGSTVQASTFVHDRLGNLEQRNFMSGQQPSLPDISETFTYDGLNRLKTGHLNSPIGSFDKTYDYDAIGNIKEKSDFADQYFYGQTAYAGPHAVTTVKYQGTTIGTYQYDANGNMTNGGGRSIDYTWFNKPTSVTEGSNFSSFSYDTSHMRIVQTSSHGVKYYLNPRIDKGGHYEKEIWDGNTIHKHFIYGPSGVVGVHKATDYGNTNVIDVQEINYFLKDHLGSIELVTDASADVLEHFSYDAFGKRRELDGRDSITRIIANSTHHGFTGHEHLDHVGLIHMNGRLYDPDLGRFTSADPMVKFATSTQGFNRYSYTDNNPLSRVDLNGYGWLSSLKKGVGKLASTAGKLYVMNLKITAAIGAGYLAVTNPGWAAGLYGTYQANEAKKMGASNSQAFWYGVAQGARAYSVLSLLKTGFTQGFNAFAKDLGNTYLNKETQEEVAYIAEKNGMSYWGLNAKLFFLSVIGNGVTDTRLVLEDEESPEIGDLPRINGVGNRGIAGAVFDGVDVVLAYQGLPTATYVDFIIRARGLPIDAAHSLGSLDASNLVRHGFAPSANLYALPFFNIAPANTTVTINDLDLVSGGPFGPLFNPDATVLHTPWTSDNFIGHGSEGVFGI